MDPLTHALSGVLVALAVEPTLRRPGLPGRPIRLVAGAAAGLLPDLAGLGRAADPLAVLGSASSWTHSLLLLPLWALLLAVAFTLLCGRARHWPVFLAIAVPAMLLHLGLDLLTVSGLQPWHPLDASRYTVPLLFVVDLWLLAILGVAAWFAWQHPALARLSALAAFAAATAYVVTVAQWRDEALALGHRQAAERGLQAPLVQAFPQPLSPRNWQVLVANAEAFDVAWVSLRGDSSDRGLPASSLLPVDPRFAALKAASAAYRAPHEVRWEPKFRFGEEGGRAEFARDAWGRPEFGAFRKFSIYTVLSHVEYRADARQICAWFYDARFALPGVVPSYRFGSCQHMDDRTWSMQRAPGPLPFL